MSKYIFINNVHRGVKKLFRFKFTKNVNKITIIKIIECAIAEYNAKIDVVIANAADKAAVIAKSEADKAIVMVDKFLAVTFKSKNDDNYRITIVRLKAYEALATAEATATKIKAIQTSINAAKTEAIAKAAMLALEANIAMSSNVVINANPNTNED
jgi:hypothetical protein